MVATTGAIRRVKLQSDRHHQQTNTQFFFTCRMPFLSPNQQCQSTEVKNTTLHGLAYLKLTWGLPTVSLTTNNFWLPWGCLPCLSHQPSDARTPENQVNDFDFHFSGLFFKRLIQVRPGPARISRRRTFVDC